jgi:hypothetical protein
VVLSSTAASAAPVHKAGSPLPISLNFTPGGPLLSICLTLAPILPTTCIPIL